MFSKLITSWKKYGFEIVLIICILFLLIFGIYRKIKKYKGTWSKQSYYSIYENRLPNNNYQHNYTTLNRRNPPKESKGEVECRRVLQKIFGRHFNKKRPNFLNNPVTGGSFNLELDCYDEQLKLAVEYNGQQHYKYIPYFHKNKESFLNQKYRDLLKEKMCKENGVNLISVPYTVKLENIEMFLIKELRKIGYSF